MVVSGPVQLIDIGGFVHFTEKLMLPSTAAEEVCGFLSEKRVTQIILDSFWMYSVFEFPMLISRLKVKQQSHRK